MMSLKKKGKQGLPANRDR